MSKIKEQRINSIFKDLDNNHTAGVSVLFMKDDSLFYKAYGMANLECNRKIDSSSVFNLASVSKQFTAFAILLLEDQGRLSLKDDVRKYLPDFSDYGNTITIENLLNHTSGVRSCLQLLGLKGFTTDNVITTNHVRQVIYNQKVLNFKPNEEFSYSNSGYFLLAQVVESITKKPFSQFLKTRIFEPLQMENSFVMDDFHRIIKNRANSYEMSNGSYVNAPANYSYTGATGVYSTIFDMVKWVENFSTHKVGNEAVFKKMKSFFILNSGEQLNYTAGQFFENYKGIKQWYHSGADAGYRTYLGRFPELNTFIILLSNNNTIDARGKALEIVDVFLGPHYKKPESKVKIAANNKFKKDVLVEQFLGHYFSKKTFITRDIFKEGDTIWYSRPEQNGRRTNLNALASNAFQLGVFANTEVRFTQDLMNVYVDSNLEESYTKYLPRNYKNKELEQFKGNYYSEELDENYAIVLENNKIVVRHPKMDVIELSPVYKDGFLSSSWQFRLLEFNRNQGGQIIGFQIHSDRVRNLKFVKI